MNTTAVITFVMLAIERFSCACSSQSTCPVSGLNTIPAAARTSGTRSPFRVGLVPGRHHFLELAHPRDFAGAGGGAGTGETGLAGSGGGGGINGLALGSRDGAGP